MHPPLLVERRDRLGAHDLAATGAHRAVGDATIDHADGRLDHITAIVDFGDDAVSIVIPISLDRGSGRARLRAA